LLIHFIITSSGHVKKDETIEQTFSREMKEEIGLDLNSNEAKMIELVTWIKDKVNKDGTVIKCRAKSSFFIIEYDGNYDDFKFDTNEVLGIGIFDAKELLKIFETNKGSLPGIIIIDKNGVNERIERGRLRGISRAKGRDGFRKIR